MHTHNLSWVCISWFLATQSEGKAWGLAQSRLNWQETDGHHSVKAKSENSGRILSVGVSQAAPSVGTLLNKQIYAEDYQLFKFRLSISLKCLSLVCNFRSNCFDTAAIHMSFSGIGLPFCNKAVLIKA